jgi:hypothetical protein
MTYTEFKNVVDTLDIKYIQVTVDLEKEFSKFKNIDLITGSEVVFEFFEEYIEIKKPVGQFGIFWLEPNTYNLHSYLILESGEDIIRNTLIRPETSKTINQIALDYDTFITLIS